MRHQITRRKDRLMTRSRRTAKQAGTAACENCGGKNPVLDGRSWRRKTCSKECADAIRRSGYTPKPKRQPTPLAERLWRRTVPGPGGCIEFAGYINTTGYGQIMGDDGRLVGAHRAAWALVNGPIPLGLVVCHRCDNRRCVNVEHLFLGTQADNVRDAQSKGRVARGERLPHTRLTDDDVRFIRRQEGFTARELAARFGVTARYINAVARGEERSA